MPSTPSLARLVRMLAERADKIEELDDGARAELAPEVDALLAQTQRLTKIIKSDAIQVQEAAAPPSPAEPTAHGFGDTTDPRPRPAVDGRQLVIENGLPCGGLVYGKQLTIFIEPGARGAGESRRKAQASNIDDMLSACDIVLAYYQETDLACEYNDRALGHVRAAEREMRDRRMDRLARGVEGTMEA